MPKNEPNNISWIKKLMHTKQRAQQKMYSVNIATFSRLQFTTILCG
jgi:tRNA A37 threonylcarbamoyladenosine synthetase subunit TsaC/SUA5/YrdC